MKFLRALIPVCLLSLLLIFPFSSCKKEGENRAAEKSVEEEIPLPQEKPPREKPYRSETYIYLIFPEFPPQNTRTHP